VLLKSGLCFLSQVTCEYGYDFWKTVTFPFLDVE
jgi:hypothetical protein